MEYVVAGAGNDANFETREKVVKWVGRGRGTSRPVQNDQRNYRKVFKRVLAKDSLEKNMKNITFS